VKVQVSDLGLARCSSVPPGSGGVPPLDVDAAAAGETYDGIPLILVRPDHIAWRSRTDPTEAEAGRTLARVTGTDPANAEASV
jgi:hypothetical protein